MVDLKHVGKVKTTGKKCLVAFRTLPGDAYNCLIVPTESLEDSYHDALIQLVESPAGQGSYEFAEVLARAKFPDGSTMLPSLHAKGKLVKVGTDLIEMTPNFTTTIVLSELNQLIAEQRGVTVGDLSVKDQTPNVEVQEVAQVKDISPTAKTTSSSVNEAPVLESVGSTPEDQAKHFRSEADRLSKQAAALRRQAEELVPTKKAK
jgi:hypothetical protein